MITNKKFSVVNNVLRDRTQGGVRPAGTTTSHSRARSTASLLGTMGSSTTMGMGSGVQVAGYLGATQYGRTMDNILPDMSEESMIPFYRDIYYYDAIGGSACDLTATFPFSEWTLSGVDNKRVPPYAEAMSRLNVRTLMPEIALSYLVDGDFIGTLVYDKELRNFTDVFVHDRMYCQVFPSPFYSMDPLITAQTSAKLRQFTSTNSPYVKQLLKNYPPKLVDGFIKGAVDLDPLTTLHVARRSLGDRMNGSASYLKRLLPVYLLEKAMYRGTLVETSKRMRATTHIMAGDDNWEPTDEEMEDLVNRFQATEMDPLGAYIATRQGVQVSDIRQAGDFFKWTDVVESFTMIKLRALCISEAFLSGDANFSCLTGDTLIPTTKGLRRIDSFGTGVNQQDRQSISVKMDSRYGTETATSWIYQGHRKTIKVTSETGNTITATGNHPMLVLRDGETAWKRTDRLQLGDLMCVSRNKVVRTEPLRLNVKKPVARVGKTHDPARVNKNGDTRGMMPGSHEPFNPGDISVPAVMTPKLAYWLSLFISEGSVYDDPYSEAEGTASGLGFGNTDKKLVDRFSQLAVELFDIEKPLITHVPLEKLKANGSYLATKDWYRTQLRNRCLIDWLEAIGVYVKPGKVDGKNPSHFKQVPWSILEADEDSQRAFLAGYAECDGSVGERTSWFSKSKILMTQIRAMLNSHGYQPTKWGNSGENVSLHREDSSDFWMHAGKYLSVKECTAHGGTYSKLDGIPARYWVDLVKSRKVKFDRHGGYFERDDGSLLCWSKNGNSTSEVTNAAPWGFNLDEVRRFSYKYYDEGRYDNFLAFLRELSPVSYEKLIVLFKTRYRYTEITSLEAGGKQHVYDISMKPGVEPAFVANGFVVHNTAENALTVFLENVESFRSFLTYRVFNYKMFPLIALANGLYKEGMKVPKNVTKQEMLMDVKYHKHFDIPTIVWHKQLIGRDGPSKMEMLNTLAEKGFPISLRTWATAAGLEIGALLNDLEEETDLRKKLAEYQKKIEATGFNPGAGGENMTGGEGLGGEEDGFDMASVSPEARAGARKAIRDFHEAQTRLKRIGIAKRSFANADVGAYTLTKTGQRKHVIDQHKFMKAQNELLVAAAQALEDPENRKRVRARVANKPGGIPNLL